ncbi:MAG: class I SAM-dependent methyltransferase [bacterium]
MRNLATLIDSRYPRATASYKERKLIDHYERIHTCIKAAARREAKTVVRTAKAGWFRGSVLLDTFPIMAMGPHEDAVLGTFPQAPATPPILDQEAGTATVTMTMHPFTDREFRVMNECLPEVEQDLSDVKRMFAYDSEARTSPIEVWDQGLHHMDEMSYRFNFHQMIQQELGRLTLPADSLVCDAACGNGTLLSSINRRFPHLRLTGNDLSTRMVELARKANPDVEIHNQDIINHGFATMETVDLMIACGLLNATVLTKDEAIGALLGFALMAKEYSYLMITGKTWPLFTGDELIEIGYWPVLRTKWAWGTFYPFYLCITPRSVEVSENRREIIPIADELIAETR